MRDDRSEIDDFDREPAWLQLDEPPGDAAALPDAAPPDASASGTSAGPCATRMGRLARWQLTPTRGWALAFRVGPAPGEVRILQPTPSSTPTSTPTSTPKET